MPYIKQEDREKFTKILTQLPNPLIKGELEYCLFFIMQSYMKDKKANYSNLHDTVYAAQHCADEFRRRFLDKREDEARNNNGDI